LSCVAIVEESAKSGRKLAVGVDQKAVDVYTILIDAVRQIL